MESQKLWVVIWVWLLGHWLKQEINKTNWEERKGKCDWLRWGLGPYICAQLITSSGSPSTPSSIPFSHSLSFIPPFSPTHPFFYLCFPTNQFLWMSISQSSVLSPKALQTVIYFHTFRHTFILFLSWIWGTGKSIKYPVLACYYIPLNSE